MRIREGLKKVIFITLASFLAIRPIFEHLLDMQNLRHIAQNIMQNDGHTMQNVVRTMRNVGPNTHNVSQGPNGGLEVPPMAPRDAPYPYTMANVMVSII